MKARRAVIRAHSSGVSRLDRGPERRVADRDGVLAVRGPAGADPRRDDVALEDHAARDRVARAGADRRVEPLLVVDQVTGVERRGERLALEQLGDRPRRRRRRARRARGSRTRSPSRASTAPRARRGSPRSARRDRARLRRRGRRARSSRPRGRSPAIAASPSSSRRDGRAPQPDRDVGAGREHRVIAERLAAPRHAVERLALAHARPRGAQDLHHVRRAARGAPLEHRDLVGGAERAQPGARARQRRRSHRPRARARRRSHAACRRRTRARRSARTSRSTPPAGASSSRRRRSGRPRRRPPRAAPAPPSARRCDRSPSGSASGRESTSTSIGTIGT